MFSVFHREFNRIIVLENATGEAPQQRTLVVVAKKSDSLRPEFPVEKESATITESLRRILGKRTVL